jgi:hypothetical protein
VILQTCRPLGEAQSSLRFGTVVVHCRERVLLFRREVTHFGRARIARYGAQIGVDGHKLHLFSGSTHQRNAAKDHAYGISGRKK